MPLNDAAVRNAKPREKSYKLADERGMFVLVNPNGSKYWRLKYRFAGKEKLLSLGVYPETSLKKARERRQAARALLADNIDPSTDRKAKKQELIFRSENGFETIAREFIKKQSNKWSEIHADNFKRRLEINIFPALGTRPIAEITGPELLNVLRKIEARGSFDLAGRMLQMCGQVLRFGVATGKCERDISSDLRGALTPHKKSHMTSIKPEEFPELLKAIDGYYGEPQTSLALQLITLTFVRTKELIAAEWCEFNFKETLWVVPAERMKMNTEHVVPLSRQSLYILEELKTLNGESKYVFTGRNQYTHMSNNAMLFALYRLGYRGRMTTHGLRSLASTILNEKSDFSPDAIERQLAHCERNAVRGAYNRAEYIQERRDLMQWYADHLDRLRGDNVIPARFGNKVS